jgi:hypothetical protein
MKVICIGGPADGMFADDKHGYLEFPIHPQVREDWGILSCVDIIRTSYQLKEIGFKFGSLEIRGSAFVWNHNQDTPNQILMKVIAMGAKT